ncbi:hypothetical protein Y032_0260g521 [Ancylostoma ceylanicum]|uniref:Uncharacterized protein n=1 Tax=Ancylostoma ceylanicum TaxID=53326 RepID=A0A016SBD2_9BILA|nr:hypothetical protein Y032_0260g521 [Ancylostoma ceylanicum]
MGRLESTRSEECKGARVSDIGEVCRWRVRKRTIDRLRRYPEPVHTVSVDYLAHCLNLVALKENAIAVSIMCRSPTRSDNKRCVSILVGRIPARIDTHL